MILALVAALLLGVGLPSTDGLDPAVRTGATSQTEVPQPPDPQPSEPTSLPREPVAGDCESWRPLLDKYGLPYGVFQPLMWRESRCSNAVNLNWRTGDESYGVLQTNRIGALAAVYDHHGIPLWFHRTPEGGVAAAALLYHSCGTIGPWSKAAGYSCRGGWPSTADTPMFPNAARDYAIAHASIPIQGAPHAYPR